jgi:hypothetical protein
MALITKFRERPGARIAWRSEVECGYMVGEHRGVRVVHLETYGSSARAIPGKVSQSIEVDAKGARELVRILTRAFPEIRSD